jgi:GTP-binding protein EngB required for normal cell division
VKAEELDPVLTADYQRLKGALLQCIDELPGIEAVRGCPCEELREKIETNAFNLVVVGQFKRGKTSLINALLGAAILPVAVIPLTSIVTIIKYGDALRIVVHFNDGRTSEIKQESLAEYVTEKGNPKNEKDVSEVVITYPSAYLKGGVRLIDTPGVGSIYQHNTDVAYQYLPKSDAAIFLLSVDQPMSKAELDFLNDVQEYSNKIFFLLNKADYLDEKDLQESVAFSKNVLKETMGTVVKIFPVSAKLALEGKTCASKETLRQSCLPEFSEALNNFLMEEKGNVLLLSVTNNLLRMISQARFTLELEMKSLATPLEELKEKIKAFEVKKKAVMLEKEDFYLLLDGETKKIVNNVLEEDLTAFRQELILKATKNFESSYGVSSGMSLKELQEHLQEQIIAEVKQAFTTWRGIEDEKLAKTFEMACKRFISKIDEAVDSLLEFSAELFAVPFDIVKAEAIWSTESVFYYKFRDQPGGIEIVALSLPLLLPKFIGEKIIIKKMKEYLYWVIDVQTARVGYDFEQRLEKSKLDFRWEMLQRIEATIEGIGAAIEKGMTLRSRSENEATERRKQVSDGLARFDEIKDRLMKLREDLGVIIKC